MLQLRSRGIVPTSSLPRPSMSPPLRCPQEAKSLRVLCSALTTNITSSTDAAMTASLSHQQSSRTRTQPDWTKSIPRGGRKPWGDEGVGKWMPRGHRRRAWAGGDEAYSPYSPYPLPETRQNRPRSVGVELGLGGGDVPEPQSGSS
jgi:hypothetical protein